MWSVNNRLPSLFGSGSRRMVAVMTLVAACLLLSLGWLSQRYVKRYQDHIAQTQLLQTMRIAYDLDERIESAVGALEEVARIVPSAALNSPVQARQWLDGRVGIKRAFYSQGMVLVNRQGQILSVLADDPARFNGDDVRKWAGRALKLEESLISPPLRLAGKAGKAELVVMACAPVIGPDGRVIGVMGGFMPIHSRSLLGGVDRLSLGSDGYFFVTAWNGQLLLHPDSSLLLRQDVHPIPPRLHTMASHGQRVTVETTDHQGQPVLSSFTKMQSTGWVLGSNLPLEEAYRPIHSFQKEALLVVLLGIGLVSLVTWGMMRLFVAPLGRLTTDISAIPIAAGALLPPIDEGRSGHEHEAFQVRRAVNQLIHRLNLAGEQARLASAVFDNACEGILVTDPEGRVISVNRAFTDITGYEPQEILGQTPRLLRSGQHDDGFYQDMWWAITRQGAWRGEIWNKRKCGEVFPELLHINAVRDQDGTVCQFVAIFSDISDIKATQNQLEAMATLDPLTGLPNRTLLADRLAQAMAHARRQRRLMIVGFIDLDGFKTVNDREGHHVGDCLLIEVAKRFLSLLHEGDTVARLGGDEFVLILNDVSSLPNARLMLDRILDAISQPYLVEGRDIRISASIGVTAFPSDNVDAEALLRHADQAMYQAKNLGRGRIHLFDAEHDRAIQTRYQEVEQIRQALANDEMELFYQPKVDLVDGTVLGLEALLRWNHPQRGRIAPPDFLGLLSGHAIEMEIGEWVLTRVMQQRNEWAARHHLSLSVSVNLTASHLLQPHFVEQLFARLDQQPHLDDHPLEIEMLETDAVRDLPRFCAIMERCRRRGVRFSIDDFGTGYSSLAYLRAIPVDMLKIDRSFVIDMLEDEDDRAIVEGVIHLARIFHCKVIAEGVETDRHAQALRDIGCHLGQGYGIARPMPAAQVPQWIAGRNADRQKL